MRKSAKHGQHRTAEVHDGLQAEVQTKRAKPLQCNTKGGQQAPDQARIVGGGVRVMAGYELVHLQQSHGQQEAADAKGNAVQKPGAA